MKHMILVFMMVVLCAILFPGPLLGSTAYGVKEGDTLYRIAQNHGTTMAKILELNPGLIPHELQIGQYLLIPQNKQVHIVAGGETLWGIARLHGISLDSLLEANRLTSDVIQVGESLLVPNRGQETTIQYVVKPSDTYWSLAVKHGTSVLNLMRLNHMVPPERLQVGSMILLPIQEIRAPKKHQVVWGDTLYRLSIRYGTEVQQLLNWNSLSYPEQLKVGQILVVGM